MAKGMCLQGLGRRDESERVVHLALEIAERLGDAALLARVHRALLLLYVWTGPPQLARRHGARAIVLAEQSGQRGVAWSAHWALAMLGGLTASVEDISHHLAEAQRLADELRSPLLRAWTAEVAIEYYAGIGEWEQAVSLAERTMAVARSLGQSTLIPRLLVWLGAAVFRSRERRRRQSRASTRRGSCPARAADTTAWRRALHRPGAHGASRVPPNDAGLRGARFASASADSRSPTRRVTSCGPYIASCR